MGGIGDIYIYIYHFVHFKVASFDIDNEKKKKNQDYYGKIKTENGLLSPPPIFLIKVFLMKKSIKKIINYFFNGFF